MSNGIAFLLMLLSAIITNFNFFFRKRWQRAGRELRHTTLIYLIVNCTAALVAYGALCGFRLTVSRFTLLCALGYATSITLNEALLLYAITRMNLMLISVFSKMSTVLSWLYGVLVLHEPVRLTGLVSLALITAAILLPLCFEKFGGNRLFPLLFGIVSALLGTATNAVAKLYTGGAARGSDAQLCFYTNAFMLAYAVLFTVCSGAAKTVCGELKTAGRSLLWILPDTGISVAVTLLGLLLIGAMPMSFMSLLSPAVGSAVVFLISKVILREESTAVEVLSFILCAVAGIVMIL